MSKLKIAEGYIISNLKYPFGNSYGKIWFDTEIEGCIEEITGGISNDFKYFDRLADGYIVYENKDNPGITVKWIYIWGASKYPIKTSSGGSSSCELGIAVIFQPNETVGVLRVYVGGAVGQLYSQLNGGPYIPVTLEQVQDGNKYDIINLTTGTYLVQVKDSASPPCIVSRVGTVIKGVDPPPLQIGDQLSFLPWVKYKIAEPATISAGILRPKLTLNVTISTDGTANTENIAPTVAELYGPGDVLGLNPLAILGTTPHPDDIQFSPLQLASIEFKEEDLPWRYSARLQEDPPDTKPKPWCFLMVLEEGEYTANAQNGSALPSIQLAGSAPFPEPAQQHLWAHVQVNKHLGDQDGKQPTREEVELFLNDELPGNPELAYSRLFCPRRLKPLTQYQAFLLPATEAGRLAGLRQALTADSAIESSWKVLERETDVPFPVYHQWKFTTSVSADFESLARELHPVTIGNSSINNVAVVVPGKDAIQTRTYPFAMPGVVTIANAVPPNPPKEVISYLYGKLAPGFKLATPPGATNRPVVTPPLYGSAYMIQADLSDPGETLPSDWRYQVNLDPRYRSVASLGAQLVQENQDEYVNRAWDQVKDILLANEKLRGGQYGLRTTAGLRDQHLPVNNAVLEATTGKSTGSQTATGNSDDLKLNVHQRAVPIASVMDNYGLQLTGMALSRIRPESWQVTIRETIRQSAMPLAVFNPAFRRINKPFGRFQAAHAGPLRRLTQNVRETGEPGNPERELGAGTTLAQRDKLLTLLNEGTLTPAPAHPGPNRTYQFDDAAIDLLFDTPRVTLTPLVLENGIYLDTFDMQDAFNEAFNVFKNGEGHPVHFTTEPRQLPALELEAVKSGVIAGTKPDKLFLARIKQALHGFTLPAATGDFVPADFSSDDFLTGSAAEPATTSAALSGNTTVTEIDVNKSVYEEVSRTSESSIVISASAAGKSAALSGKMQGDHVTAALPVIPQINATPVFKDAMGELLRQRHPELFLPGISDFPANGIAVLSINHAFVEAFLLGANHALGSELLWRQFPVDLRGSYFQQFWDVSEQINMQSNTDNTRSLEQQEAERLKLEQDHLDIWPLHQWDTTALSKNSKNVSASNLMIAARSDLFRRYPNLIICAQPANLEGKPNSDDKILYPRQQLAVGQDIVTINFDLSLDEATGKDGGRGYFLVFMERPGQPQFGLDEKAPETSGPLASWNDLSWEYMGTAPGANLHIDPAPTGKPFVFKDPVPLVTNSAELAYALFQEPVRAAIHASRLLQ